MDVTTVNKWIMALGLRTAAAASKPSFARRNQTSKVDNNMKCMRPSLLTDFTML